VRAIPWKSFRPADSGGDYVLLLSVLPLKRRSSIPRCLLHTWRIMGQLKNAKGLMGYSLFARPLAGEFSTLSVWETDAALDAFVRASPHARTMADMTPHMKQTRFVKRRIQGSAIPPTWDYALSLPPERGAAAE
jgi:quinol monooxygenase YgiN